MSRRAVTALLATTSLALATGTPASAQATPPDSATGSQPDTVAPQGGQVTPPTTNATGGTVGTAGNDIVITGTRIPQPNLTSASPVTVLSSQEVKLSGKTRTDDLLNSLPQAYSTQGSNISTGSTGTAPVTLRHPGPQ